MLLFNPVLTGNRKFLTIFQNISCYCLTCTKLIRHTAQHISKHLMLLFNFFNAFPSLLIPLFQNISCYCLTIHTFLHPADLYIFQNISCYCLTSSQLSSLFSSSQISKHLMLLFNQRFYVIF